jgi:hypothetical protein
MIGFGFRFVDETQAVVKAVDKGAYRSLSHAAASIRKSAIESIVTSKGPSPAGQPPHTLRGLLRRAIVFFADKEGAVIGPTLSRFGTAAQAHEFGGRYKKQVYPKRPFMGPALERNLARFAKAWGGEVRN